MPITRENPFPERTIKRSISFVIFPGTMSEMMTGASFFLNIIGSFNACNHPFLSTNAEKYCHGLILLAGIKLTTLPLFACATNACSPIINDRKFSGADTAIVIIVSSPALNEDVPVSTGSWIAHESMITVSASVFFGSSDTVAIDWIVTGETVFVRMTR